MSLELSRNPRDIIIKPVITEKTAPQEDQGKYTFIVDPKANKTEIKIAIEKIFGVKVASVNTLNRPGKTVRTRTGFGKRKDTKRAVVTLREGTIDFGALIG
ncbi:50S ribosomal protein L23 [Boudabousia liubingyangii]|uniref:Large ribosomal subunit protein uL23 n=1 Tax=Boudabousia liubingyangii TaxID=1921764 RepID=A0A1Q5PQD8_9ACTO|nr:50S ribosomal protein L23 [Boudabousia liubingyangii]OKL48252.1 50S ribosomal protein L23 [Boudabousia liubingyangii]OKL49713.1 50S ribosomal protein L23 [Boudabousia liubingyangii]